MCLTGVKGIGTVHTVASPSSFCSIFSLCRAYCSILGKQECQQQVIVCGKRHAAGNRVWLVPPIACMYNLYGYEHVLVSGHVHGPSRTSTAPSQLPSSSIKQPRKDFLRHSIYYPDLHLPPSLLPSMYHIALDISHLASFGFQCQRDDFIPAKDTTLSSDNPDLDS